MNNSSESDSPPQVLVFRLSDECDLVTTPGGSAIASGDGPPILLQNLN